MFSPVAAAVTEVSLAIAIPSGTAYGSRWFFALKFELVQGP